MEATSPGSERATAGTKAKVCSRDTVQIVMSKGQSGQGEKTSTQSNPHAWGLGISLLLTVLVDGSLGIFLASVFAHFGHRNPLCNQMPPCRVGFARLGMTMLP